MNDPVLALRALIGGPIIRLEWAVPRTAGLRRWRLVIAPISRTLPHVEIDTGLSTHTTGYLTKTAGPAIVKAVACIISGLGPKVILPSGQPMPDEWLRESLLLFDPSTFIEVKRLPPGAAHGRKPHGPGSTRKQGGEGAHGEEGGHSDI